MDNENKPHPGGETLNDRLRRAAAMSRKFEQESAPASRPEPAPAPHSEAPGPRTEQPQRPEPAKAPASRPEPQPSRPEPQPSQAQRPAGRPAADERHPHRNPEAESVYVAPQSKNGKKTGKLIVGLVVVLAVVLLAAAFLLMNQKKQNEEQQQQIEQLQLANDQIQLANEYAALNNEFAQYENQTSLLANDSIVQKYSAARAQVEKLLQELNNEKHKSAAQIKKLQDEIATLKGILRTYVEQINQLNQENQELRTENTEVKEQNRQLSANIQTVEANNKVLNERMTLAEKLNVTGVNLVALNKKGKKEKHVAKARQLMVTFTIPQNNSTPVGEKTIWVRISNPEGDLLTGGGSFQFEGSTLGASARKQIEYGGEEIGGITVYWDVNSTLNPGEYTVELFCDNYRLSSRRFTLSK